MEKYLVELILKPERIIGRRYIFIEVMAENETIAGEFAIDMMKPILMEDVKIEVKSVTINV